MTNCSKINHPSGKEIQKIYEKSVKLLGDSQVKLSEMQQVLKKSVIRLSTVSHNNDEEVKNSLAEIKASVKNNIKLKKLNAELDNLFVLMNRPDYKQNVVKQRGFYEHLKSDLDKFEHSNSTASWRSKLTDVLDKKLPDNKISLEILKIINEISISNYQSDKINHDDNIASYENGFTNSTETKYDLKNNALQALQTITVKLKQSIVANKLNKPEEIYDNQTSSENYQLKISSTLIDIIGQLSLAGDNRQQLINVQKALNNPVECDKSWFDVIFQAISLINQSVSSNRSINDDLQTFIGKINNQLSEIKSFFLMERQDRKDTICRTSDLQESVDTCVCSIQKKIFSTNNIRELKTNISVHLENIRNQVEENKLAEEKKEEISIQGFAHIVNELNSAQKESSSLKEKLLESQKQLLRDSLTGLANRLAYEERVAIEYNRWKRNKTPLSLAIWDIDYFKNVNDTYGHAIGDRVLKLFSKIIISRIRNVDLFARIGGEEFVLLMPDTSLDNAMKLNNNLRELLENYKFQYHEKDCPVTASVGIAEFRQNDDAERVLKRADKALYQSKNAGRNCCTAF